MAQLTPVEPHATDAWIDTAGRFYPVRECGHSKWAYEWLTSKGMDHDEAWRGTQHLENEGWVHLSYGCILIRDKELLTSEQMDTLFATLAAYRNARYRAAESLEWSMKALMED